jgi:molybdopterin converting factor small subunit
VTRPVRVVLFAAAREAVGARYVDREVPPTGSTVEKVLSGLVAEHPRLQSILRASRFVRNGHYVQGPRARVAPGDEIAVHPPYSGG